MTPGDICSWQLPHQVSHPHPQAMGPGPSSEDGDAPQQLLSRPQETGRLIPDRHRPFDRNCVLKQVPRLVRGQINTQRQQLSRRPGTVDVDN